MYIRVIKKKRTSERAKTFFQYSLVQNTRVNNKVKQENILYLGSSELLADETNRKNVLLSLKAKIYNQPELFEEVLSQDLANLVDSYYQKYLNKYTKEAEIKTPETIKRPPVVHKADFQEVDLNSLEVSEVRSFGAEHLCNQVSNQLALDEHLQACGFSRKEVQLAKCSIISRAIFSASEWKTAHLLAQNSSLCELLGMETIPDHRQLYAISDRLYQNREKIDQLLYSHIQNLFNLKDKIVIFDLSNTYFETSRAGSELAQFGRSKEKRSDCPLVVFTALINQEGFLRDSKIYEGSKADPASLEDMINHLEKSYQTQACLNKTEKLENDNNKSSNKPTVVLDAGIATEDNLTLIRQKGYDYVCVARCQLKEYVLDDKKWVSTNTKNEQTIQLQKVSTDAYDDQWLYVKSEAKQRKEQSIDSKLAKRYEADLEKIKTSLSKPRANKSSSKIWERIGRAKQKNSRVTAGYELEVIENDGIVTDLKWKLIPMQKHKADKNQGVYFIRTSLTAENESALWQIYNTIREVESTFRCLKSDLNIRPVHHQNDQRIKAHIYLTLLAYQLVNTIRHQLKTKKINDSWQTVIRKAQTQTIQNVELATKIKIVHMRKPSKAITELQEIYKACQCNSTIKAKRKYVTYY